MDLCAECHSCSKSMKSELSALLPRHFCGVFVEDLLPKEDASTLNKALCAVWEVIYHILSINNHLTRDRLTSFRVLFNQAVTLYNFILHKNSLAVAHWTNALHASTTSRLTYFQIWQYSILNISLTSYNRSWWPFWKNHLISWIGL